MGRLGILGGTFDPIHNGHLRLGEKAMEQFGLERVVFMPSGHPPHKRDHLVTDGADREEMVRLAIAGEPRFSCSDFELRREGATYTAQTLSLLHKDRPEQTFYFIVGADSLYEIEHWFHPREVMAQAVLLAAGRPYRRDHRSLEEQIAYLRDTYGARVERIELPEMDIASEEIRRLAAAGRSVRAYVPPAVADYIEAKRLYQGGERT